MRAIVAIVLLCSGCGVTVGEHLTIAHKSGILARQTVMRSDFCAAPKQDCIDARVLDSADKCNALQKCHDTKLAILKSLDSMQSAVLIGLLAVAAADKKGASAAAASALSALVTIREALSAWGVTL